MNRVNYINQYAAYAQSSGEASLAPGDIANLRNHWDAQDVGSFTLGASDVVDQWNDLVGTKHLIPDTNKPVRQVAESGRVYFDGLTNDCYLKNTSWGPYTGAEFTHVIVMQKTDAASQGGSVAQVGGPTQYFRSYQNGNGNSYITQLRNGGGISTISGGSLTTTTKHVFALRFNEDQDQKTEDTQGNTASTTFDLTSGSTSMSELYIGALPSDVGTLIAGYYLEGYVYEICFYSRYITDEELAGLFNHLTTKHSI